MNINESRKKAQAAFMKDQLQQAIGALRELERTMSTITIMGEVNHRRVARCLKNLERQGLDGWLLNVLNATADSVQRDSEGFEAIGISRERLEDLHDRSTS